ncbi:hypothetical protein AZI86_05180 [Bdellovibrio bacteriovorus]|uniref:N-acetyltransferase domain-containing protein n=1 Tax=Bdellovibrio bacteriovorus TaxID=959 RepID=A0A150WPN4_BDEBC|nr:GNAT family N-acetyltransferase [Bdellovibrio bacteriovorus]KYG66442.1 hypothetical protein AZI86_05180 [Bdellovibrio bacteriovorus]
MSLHFFTVKKLEDLKRCFPVMRELRPHLSYEEYLLIYQEAQKTDGYEIVAVESGDQILALIGYRFLSDFVRGRHLYIDDLVSTESARSQGLGAKLLIYAEEIAKQNKCKVLRLCTGVENERGVKFYEKNNWTKRAYAYAKKIG